MTIEIDECDVVVKPDGRRYEFFNGFRSPAIPDNQGITRPEATMFVRRLDAGISVIVDRLNSDMKQIRDQLADIRSHEVFRNYGARLNKTVEFKSEIRNSANAIQLLLEHSRRLLRECHDGQSAMATVFAGVADRSRCVETLIRLMAIRIATIETAVIPKVKTKRRAKPKAKAKR